MRRLQHLSGVLRVEVGVVVVHALGHFQQHFAHRGLIYMRRIEGGERRETFFHPLERLPEQSELALVELK